ncbi:sugar ABC transporter substrate-binding protein [Paenibacillus andongensis]|uniref:sugar ABC transporter substrate-binding protein n=1 Tax=Paenibacillus andongensis TaxID=2975482 RepID=UPI0021BA4F80|nr:substrate-binding domain-containing protein [Paenibacillus andongensis]
MRMIKWLTIGCIMLLILTGCKGSTPSTQESFSTSSTPKSTMSNTKHSDPLIFGIIYPMTHPFYEMITDSIEKASKPYSIQLIVKAPDEINLEQQMRMMETMIAQKVNGIAIDPIDPVALTPIINKAAQAGIPVICFESDVPGSKRYSFIGSDPLKEGTLMGQIIDRNLKGRGMIMIEGSLSKSPQISLRLDGLLQYLKQKTEIQVLEMRYHDGDNEKAISDLEVMINEHPHFDALVPMDIVSSSNAILVWKSQGLKRYAITFGMTPDVKEALLNGQISSVISENEHLWGDKIIEQLLTASRNAPSSTWIDTGFQEIKQSNMDVEY